LVKIARDVFEQRIEAQYARFYRETAERIRRWAERESLDPIVLAGPNRVLQCKTQQTDGYNAVQLGFGEQKEQRLTKLCWAT
jgi:sirohydrochlorin ferrochelatase